MKLDWMMLAGKMMDDKLQGVAFSGVAQSRSASGQ
jgi:hypothetical protein